MNKKICIILILVLLLSSLFLFFSNKDNSFKIIESSNKDNSFEIIESSSDMDMDMDIDIVYYPYSIGLSNIDIDSFALLKSDAKPIEHAVDKGYSSVVNINVMSKLFDYLSLDSMVEVEEKLGQYCSYRNFDGVEILIFYNWYDPPYELNIVIINGNSLTILSEEFNNENLFPIAIKQCENGAILLLRDENNFELRKIDTINNSIKSASFEIENNSENYYYFVDVVFANDKLYLMTNKLDQERNDSAYLFTYDMATDILNAQQVASYPIDFFSGTNQSLCYGSLTTNNTLNIYQMDLTTHKQSAQTLTCIDNVKAIHPNSALYDGSQLYINLTVERKYPEKKHGVLYRYDLNNLTIVNRFLYAYNGSIWVKYFDKDTSFTYDSQYATGY